MLGHPATVPHLGDGLHRNDDLPEELFEGFDSDAAFDGFAVHRHRDVDFRIAGIRGNRRLRPGARHGEILVPARAAAFVTTRSTSAAGAVTSITERFA